ncbi:MAG: hypothetical protein KAR57_00480 [Bacteroidales bacterium]|nr:hypothetical protein [Bacteroidales bacterium]
MKSIIKPGDEIPKSIGGKAKNLLEMVSHGIPTSPFIVVPDTWFESLCKTGLVSESGIPYFDKIKIPESVLSEIKCSLSDDCKYVAVRSSYRDEDSDKYSYAGQFKTKLFVPFEKLEEAILEVWASVKSKEVQEYCKTHGLKPYNYLSVIIQEMIQPTVSGVAFSMNPVTGHRKQKLINTVFGLGEGLVSGELKSDQFIVTNNKIEQEITSKEHQFVFDKDSGFGIVQEIIEADKRDIPTISKEQVEIICQKLDLLKNLFGKHQDIEFAFLGDKLYILQSRPITNLHKLSEINGRYIVWDNSNIVESYPGITSPLTFSYIIQLYDRAYRQFVELMGVSQKEIEKNSDYFANMLGYLNGRIYYNLRSWYKMIAMLPGYSFNARFMEKMMGVKEKFDLDDVVQKSKFKDFFRIIYMIYSILKNSITLEAQKRKFTRFFNNLETSYISIDPDSLTADQIMALYKKHENLLLKNWKAPLVNDFFAMIYFGLLQKSMSGLFGKETNIHNDLLFDIKTIITTEPAELIEEIVLKIFETESFYTLFKSNSAKEILYALLDDKKYELINDQIISYIDKFGDRQVGELKLETKTYRHHPEMFISVLQSYILRDRKPSLLQRRSESKIRVEAERKVRKRLRFKPFKYILIKHITRRTRNLVSGRENLRFYRTRAFGSSRLIFLTLGKIFYSEDLLSKPEDIFMLTKDEIFSFIQGTSANYNLKDLVKIRNSQFEKYYQEPVQGERIKTHGIVYQGNSFYQENPIITTIDGLKGIGCCKGIVKGKVKIISSPEQALCMDGDILVTTTTDPGWVTIFPSISGILVERGSLLSHAAIVSREMGIPCIVGINGLTEKLKSGDYIEMDGEKGIVNIVNEQ